jgi:hypothetical protein
MHRRVSTKLRAAAFGGVLGGSLFFALAGTADADEVPIVYSRCPRGHKPFTVTGPVVKGGVETMATVTLEHGELEEALPETARSTGAFVAPCDLVYRDAKGTEKILYSCIASSTPENACAALDASVSFDAKTIAFSVFRGKLDKLRASGDGKVFDPAAENVFPKYFSAPLPGSHLVTKEAQIVLVDVASGKQTPLPFPPETINFGPTWTSDGRISFSSVRRPIYAPMPVFCNNNSGNSIQLYTMDPDGRNVELATPHALAAELHPLQLADGRVATSSWQTFGMLSYRHGNAWGGCGTTPNFFHVYAQNPDGAHAVALFGQHLSDPIPGEPHATHMAAHFLGQTSDGRVWTAEYYRANNLGLGNIVGFPLPADGQEGPNVTEAAVTKTSAYRLAGEIRLADWATPADQAAGDMPPPQVMLPGYTSPIKHAGKLGHPSGLPGNKLMVSWGVGMCTQNTGALDLNVRADWAKTNGDSPVCDVGIYRTAELPTTGTNPLPHPSGLVAIVNSPDFHEFMARPVVPYSEIHQVEKPKVIPRAEVATGDVSLEHGTPFGVLGASSIIHRETNGGKPVSFEGDEWAYRGTDAIDYTDDELCGVRILAVYPNRKVESYWKSTSTVGERVAIVGEFPVRKANGAKDALGHPDTSFRVRFPADTPYLMQGIDCEGRTLNTDQTWQSLRAGEVKTCNGCHVHSAAATKLPYAATIASMDPVNNTAVLGAGKVPLLAGGSGATVQKREVDGYAYMIEFDTDVMPIFQKRCVSCHSGPAAQAGLRLDIARDWAKVQANKDDSTYTRLALDSGQGFVPANLRYMGSHGANLGKPQISKYVRMLNSRGSLLYWKAKNQRTDNRTDSSRSDDVDFGANHPTEITPDELATIARWIETGTGWGPDFKQDNLFPSLHLVGVAADKTLTALKVGTVDTGSGIDPDSLTVCVAPAGAPCGPNLAGKAELAGVSTIKLAAPLADLDAEVVATVKDRAGNVREERKTVRFLLALPPPPPPSTTGPGGPGDGAANGADAAANADDSGCGCRVVSQQAPSFAAGGVAFLLALSLFLRRSRARA